MPATWLPATLLEPGRWRRLVLKRRRGAVAMLVADTVLLSAAAAVWLPLLAANRDAAPSAPSPSVIVSPSPSIITRVEPPAADRTAANRTAGDNEQPLQPGRPLSPPVTPKPAVPATLDPALPPTPEPSRTATVGPTAPPTEHETPSSPEPSPTTRGQDG